MTRRTLFMRLLGVVGAGAFAQKALALGGWKEISGPGDCCCERVVATKRVHPEYLVETVETIWYWDGWEHVRLDRAMSTHGEALGKKPIYIGDPKDAKFLAVKKGLVQLQPRLGGPGKVCSIGFCPGDGKWYGWSHRAIFGFGADDLAVSDPNLAGGIWEQAKLAASRFAESVS